LNGSYCVHGREWGFFSLRSICLVTVVRGV